MKSSGSDIMQPKTVKLRSGRLGAYMPGHPWVYKRHLLKTDPSIKPGSVVDVIDSSGKRMGRGYYNPHSDIAVRILTAGDEEIGASFFASRMALAAAKRSDILKETDAYRAVYSEADGLPGLIVDLYRDTAVFQVLTLGIERFKETVVEAIDNVLKPKYIYERSDSAYRKEEGLGERRGWWGDEGSACVEMREGRARFLVDIVTGHKTGFYLDQRNSRLAAEQFSCGKDVLDLFCYTGGFAVHAALGGAKSVLAADIKEDWLALGRRNMELSGVGGRGEFVKADALELVKNLGKSRRTFDMIIVDPPSFAKSKHSVPAAVRGYETLNLSAMKMLNPGGVLATFSCSHSMANDAFSAMLKGCAARAGKSVTILKRCHQSQDHPIVRGIPETEYLKGYFLKVDSK